MVVPPERGYHAGGNIPTLPALLIIARTWATTTT